MEGQSDVMEFLVGLDSADGLFAVDDEQSILSWNLAAEEITGRSADDVVGKKCYESLAVCRTQTQASCRRDCRVMANVRRGRTTRDFDLQCETPDGETRWLNVSIINLNGERARALHVFRDITDRRRVEQTARRKTNLRNRMNGSVDGMGKRYEVESPMPALSRREDQVLRLLAAGAATTEIAGTLGVRTVTARNHVGRLMNKLGARTRLQAVMTAAERGLL